MVEKKQNRISSEHQSNGFSSLSASTAGLVKKLFGAKGLAEIKLLSNWENIVGKDLADFSLPKKIEFKKNCRNNGILHLLISGGAFAMEIQYKTPFILEKINTFFGYQAITQIKIIQNDTYLSPLSESKFDDKPEKKLVTEQEQNYISKITEKIENPELKMRLQKLGESIFKQNK